MKKDSRHFDWWLFVVLFTLIIISVPVVFSAGAGIAMAKHNSDAMLNILIDQSSRCLMALGFLVLGAFIPYQSYGSWSLKIPFKKYDEELGETQSNIPVAKIILACIAILLIAVLLTHKVNNTHRWLSFGGFSFQPSELARYTLIIYLSWSLSRTKEYTIHNFVWGFLPKLLPVLFIVGLVIIEPHLSVSAIMLTLSFILFYFARARVTHLLFIVLLMMCAGGVMYYKFDYIRQRIDNKMKGDAVSQTAGKYQIQQSLIAFGSGGVASFKPGQSKQRDLFLPEAKGDFVYAIIGEEYGFTGAALVALLFFMLIQRGIKIALRAQDEYAKLLAIGLTASLGIQAMVNMMVALDITFLTGLPMPFISYGGTSLLVSSFAAGILLNISMQTRKQHQIVEEEFEEVEEDFSFAGS